MEMRKAVYSNEFVGIGGNISSACLLYRSGSYNGGKIQIPLLDITLHE